MRQEGKERDNQSERERERERERQEALHQAREWGSDRNTNRLADTSNSGICMCLYQQLKSYN